MYKVKRFSQEDFSSFVLKNLPKKFINPSDKLYEDNIEDDDDLFSELSSSDKSNIKYILQNFDKLAIPAIKEYEEDEDTLKLIKASDLYVFDIQLDQYAKGNYVIQLATSFRKFEDWMGWFDVTIDIRTKKVDDVSYGD